MMNRISQLMYKMPIFISRHQNYRELNNFHEEVIDARESGWFIEKARLMAAPLNTQTSLSWRKYSRIMPAVPVPPPQHSGIKKLTHLTLTDTTRPGAENTLDI